MLDEREEKLKHEFLEIVESILNTEEKKGNKDIVAELLAKVDEVYDL